MKFVKSKSKTAHIETINTEDSLCSPMYKKAVLRNSKSWTIGKLQKKKRGALETWCCATIFKINWIERR